VIQMLVTDACIAQVGRLCEQTHRANGNVLDWAYHTAGVQYAYTVRLRDTGTVRLTAFLRFHHFLCATFLRYTALVVASGPRDLSLSDIISSRLISNCVHFYMYFSTSLSITFMISSPALHSLLLPSNQHLIYFTRLEIQTDILLSYSMDSPSRPPRSVLQVPKRRRWSRTSRGL
jgi:hypothetical protein